MSKTKPTRKNKIDLRLGRSRRTETDTAHFRRWPLAEYPAFAIVEIRSKFQLPTRFVIVQQGIDGLGESVLASRRARAGALTALKQILTKERRNHG